MTDELKSKINNLYEYNYIGKEIILGITFYKFKCKECSHEFIVDYDTLIYDESIYCSKDYDVYPRYKNSNQLIREFYDNNRTLELLDIPISKTDSIDTRCKVCGNVTLKRRIRNTSTCKYCANENKGKKISETKLSNSLSKIDERAEHFKSQIESLNSPTFKVISRYKGHNRNIMAKCLHCGKLFITTAKSLSKGRGHSNCRYDRASINNPNRKTNDKFLEDVKRVHGDKYSVISEYSTAHEKVELHCDLCGNTWYASPNKLVSHGTGCPNCLSSSSEAEIREFVGNYYNCYKKMFSINGVRRELDIYIPEINIGIEFDGLWCHTEESLESRAGTNGSKYHHDKQKLFNSIGIRTIHIREDEWREKKEIVKSRILNIIGKTERRLYARKCDIREISSELKSEFLKRYHIQGNDNSSIRIGLFYKGKLVSIMTFGKVRDTLRSSSDVSEDVYELLRFSNRTNLSVIGGFSKLLKHCSNYLKSMGVTKIKTFADKRWSYGNVYEKNGFTLSHESNPNYIYYSKSNGIYSRYSFQKHKLENLYNLGILEVYDKNMSESLVAELNGFCKIYDCGNLVYYKNL